MAPELFIAIVIGLIFAGIVVFAWFWTSDPARQPTAAAEERRLAQQIVWLESRLKLAQEEAWDETILAPLAEQLAAARVELALRRTGEM
jgi:hypothetical protein